MKNTLLTLFCLLLTKACLADKQNKNPTAKLECPDTHVDGKPFVKVTAIVTDVKEPLARRAGPCSTRYDPTLGPCYIGWFLDLDVKSAEAGEEYYKAYTGFQTLREEPPFTEDGLYSFCATLKPSPGPTTFDFFVIEKQNLIIHHEESP